MSLDWSHPSRTVSMVREHLLFLTKAEFARQLQLGAHGVRTVRRWENENLMPSPIHRAAIERLAAAHTISETD